MTTQPSLFGVADDGPLVLSYGVGVDSTAVLVGWHARGIRPDLIMFADTGAEHGRTYRYLEMAQRWLAAIGFPPVVVVRYRPNHGRYQTIMEECILKMVLPSLAYGRKSCSQKWKVAPQQRYLAAWKPAVEAWSRGARIRNAIGYDAGPKDRQRGLENVDTPLTRFVFPLRDWGWDRDRCEAEIAACGSLAAAAAEAGIPVSPGHSSCVCCPSMRPEELVAMQEDEPDSLAAALALERVALPHLTKMKGLWREDGKDRPGSWNAFAMAAIPDAKAAAPDAAARMLRRGPAMAAPPEGTRYATWEDGAAPAFHTQLQGALAAAGRGPIGLWVDGSWYESVEDRRPGLDRGPSERLLA